MWKCPWTLLVVLACVSGEYLMGGHLDNNSGAKSRSEKIDNSFALERKRHVDDLDPDLIAEESTVGAVAGATASSTSIDNDVPRYHIPSYPFAFNGGKPFSLEKDPITGKIDFEKAPPVGALNYTGRYHEHENEKENVNISEEAEGEEDTYAKHGKTDGNGNDEDEDEDDDDDDVSPNEINANTINFHDFLHLPINYSSDKYGNDKYPLISNSYANTKVQSGANSYSTYNHRPYHPETSDSYAHPTGNSYMPMMNTSAIHNATIVTGFKAKLSTVAYPVKSSTSRAPVVTTWKPSTTTTALDSVNRILSVAEKENEESVLSVERLHISSHVAGYKNPSDIPTQSGPNDKTTEEAQTVTRYKNQPTRNNLVSSHLEMEAKLYEAQHDEYKDSHRDTYDIYESQGDEGEDGIEVEGEIDDDDEESDSSFPDLPRKHAMQSTPSATAVNAMASTASTTADTVTTLSKGITSAVTTIAPSGSVSSTQHMILHAGDSPQSPIISQTYPKTTSSSLISNLGQSIVDRYDPNTSHEYKTGMKSERDRVGDGIVIESTSNIVIPPDQDTVSFVLGNRQNVEDGYYSVGTAIGENPYGSLSDIDTSFWPLRNNPHGPIKKTKYDQPAASVAEPDRVAMQKWWLPGASVLKSSDELEPPRSQSSFAAAAPAAFAASVATVDTNKSRSEGKVSGYVTFPDVETKDKDTITKEHTRIVVVNEANDTRELPSKATLTTTIRTTTTVPTSKTKINFSSANAGEDFPQLAESLMPPAESSIPPPYYYQYQYDTNLRPDRTRPQRLPPPPRIKPGFSGSPLDVGSRRRPYSPEAKLPNILPQFRPNTKTSHGHRFGSDVIGTLPAGQSLPSRIRQPLQNHPPSRRPFPPPPSYLQRLNPPPPPIHAVRLAFVPTPKVDGAASLHETEPTIRKFRPPHMSAISRGNTEENAQLFNKSFDRVTEQDEYETTRMRDQGKSAVVDERENESSERYPEEPPMTPPRPPLFPKRRTADPQHVTTLQMIQHHGEFANNDENEARLTQQPVEPVLAHQAERRKSDNHDLLETAEQPVYVVYPVNTAVNVHSDNSKEDADADADVDVDVDVDVDADADDIDGDASVVVGTRGPHRPLPPDTLLQEEREKDHAVHNGRPVSVASDFPYPLEHPDLTSMFPVAGTKETPLLVPSEQRQQTALASDQGNEQNEQDATNVIPYLQDFLPYQKKNDATISVTLHRTGPILTSAVASSSMATPTLAPAPASASASASASTPTPIAYVYTPTRAAAYPIRHLDDDAADTSIDATATVLTSSQRPSSSSNSAPMPQNFMAPFVASISAEAPSKNGWNVVVIEPPLEADQKLDGDNDGANLTSSEMDTPQTERNDFDADNFKPQLFGGFKPIYEFPTEYMERRDDTNFETDTSRHPKGLTVPGKR